MAKSEMGMTRSMLGAVLGVSHTTVSKWISLGLPVGVAGRLDPVAARVWLDQNRVSPDTATGQGYAVAKGKREAAMASMAEMQLAKMRDQTLDAAEVRQLLSSMVIQVRDGFMALPGLLCDRLAVMSDATDIMLLLETEICKVLQRFADAAARDLGAEVNLGK